MRRLITRTLLTLDGIALLAATAVVVRYGWTSPAKLAVLTVAALTVGLGATVVVTYTVMRRRELIPPPAAYHTRATVLIRSYMHPEQTSEGTPRVEIETEVTLPDRPSVRRTYWAEIPYLDAARFAEGVRFPCLVDPANLDQIRVYPRFALDASALTDPADRRRVALDFSTAPTPTVTG